MSGGSGWSRTLLVGWLLFLLWPGLLAAEQRGVVGPVTVPSASAGQAPLDSVDAMHAAVEAALHDWLTWKRADLIEAWEQYQYMRHLMWPAYQEAGLPEGLLFGMLAKESGGRVHAVSRVGAAGPLQFMAHTGRRFGLEDDGSFDERFDPRLATRANVAYLQERFDEFGPNLELALAAYNGGEGRVRRLLQGAEASSFWADEVRARLPRETQDYVPWVLAAALLFSDPQLYGLEFPEVDATPGTIRLQRPATLGELAICLGQVGGSRNGWFRTLRNLNPREEPFERLPRGTELAVPVRLEAAYADRCVDASGARLAASLHDSRDHRRPASLIYTVRTGDTLSSIARQHGCPSTASIAEENSIRAPRYLIRPGQRLTLSGCRS